MDFLTILPLAFVMIAGPQIISAFFFATSDSWRASSAAYRRSAALISLTLDDEPRLPPDPRGPRANPTTRGSARSTI